ncbi:MAG: hypothetical protein M0016_02610 [Deltaproteobacteria bacterium]|jgi:hypothetical protein|nr:hypothetical protein [Deltaproteobacteria bacterium]MCL5880539.1 hypothetical protein [Deltaproteobacteria bacterium]MDA8304037.1 hypothetical protein [Deltaproteobacteria bacterium]
MKNSIDLKIRIANKILVINKYILLALLEKREKIGDIARVFDRKLFFTKIFSKIPAVFNDNKIPILKKKLIEITELEKVILDILMARKEEAGEKIKFFQKITVAIKAYKLNNIVK